MKRFLVQFSFWTITLMALVSVASALDNDETQIRKDLPRLLGTSNQGKEFFMTFHPCWETAGAKDALYIYITSAVATRVTIEIPGKGVYLQQTTIPNDIIQFSFDPSIGQCYRKSDREQAQPQRVFEGYGIIVNAEDPIVCYGVTRFQYTSDGYLAIPKSGLGTKYVVSSYNNPCEDNGNQYLCSFTSIVGAYKKTEVKVKLGGRFSNYTPGKNSMKTGDTRREILNRGDVWLIGVQGDYSDLTGTTVEANKPVAVISGNFCAYIPIQMAACDFIIEQDLPMETWGTRYHVTKIIKRLKGSIIRVFASEPNTTIYRDGNEWSYIKSVGGEEGSGYIERRALNSDEPLRSVTISAKSRIAVTQYNSGISDDQVESDPFQLALTPIEQYQNAFIWCTPGFNGGAFFKENYLNICYQATSEGQMPQDIEFGKVSNGVVSWRKLSTVVSSSPDILIDESDSSIFNTVTIVLPDPAGVYALRGNEGMAAYGYGFDWCDSYGFPVSLALADLTKPDIWAPLPSYTIDCLGRVEGKIIEQPESNADLRSNLADIRLIRNESYNFSDLIYDEDNFIPGQTFDVDWSLNVLNLEHDAMAVIAFSDRSGNDTVISIEYKHTKLSIKNKIENWGVISFGDAPEYREFKLINESGKPIVIDSILLLSSDKNRNESFNGFSLDPTIYKQKGGVLPGYTLQDGEELKFRVCFDAQTVKNDILKGKNRFLDSICVKAYWSTEINNYCYYKYIAAVKASTGSPCIRIDRLDFGKITVNNSTKKMTAIFNNGSADLTIISYNAPNGVFIPELDTISPSKPLVVPPGESFPFKVAFTPDQVQIFSDQIVFESDGDTNCVGFDPVLELTGEGIQPGLELLGFDWLRMRVHLPVYDRPSNPYGNSNFPYSSKIGNDLTSLRLRNTGTQAFTITEASIKDGVNPEYFVMDFDNNGIVDGTLEANIAKLIGKEILPDKDYIYPVYYDPKNVGNHSVTVIVKGEKDGYQVEGECKFRGTGIHPKGHTSDYMFTKDEPNQTAIVDAKHLGFDAKVQYIADKWGDFTDKLKIYDVKLVDSEGKAISTDINTPGFRLFAFNKDSLDLPKVLNPGDTFSFPAKYYPYKSSPNYGKDQFAAHVVFVTDADLEEYSSEWTGKSQTQSADAKGFSVHGCVLYEEYGTANIINTGNSEIKIDSIYIKPIGGDTSSFTVVDNKPFRLAADESKDIQVLFKQTNAGITDASIIFVTSIKSAPEISAPINGEAFSYPRKTIGKINGNIYTDKEPFKITINKKPKDGITNKFTYSIELLASNSEMEEVTKPTDFYVEIVYNSNILGSEFDGIKKQIKVDLGYNLNSSDYAITDIKEEKVDDKTSKIKATIKNISGNPLTSRGDIEILKLIFIAYLPNTQLDLSNRDGLKIQINQSVTSNEPCIPLSADNTSISNPYIVFEEICALNTRLIQLNDEPFGIDEINPNPIDNNGADINYTLGFDCNAELTIFNSAGSAVAKLIDNKQTEGKHSVAIPIEQLASGVYFVELKAGPYVGTKRLVINK